MKTIKKRLMTITLMANLLTVSLLTGCMVGPKYHRPAVKPPDVFRGSPDPTPPADPDRTLSWHTRLTS